MKTGKPSTPNTTTLGSGRLTLPGVPMRYNDMKKFILLCDKNAGSLKSVFPMFKDGEVHYDDVAPEAFLLPDGIETTKLKGKTRWLTNLSGDGVGKKAPKMPTESYYADPTRYPKYDNYDAIEVGRLELVPADYEGPMGVPVTYLDNQLPGYEILGILAGEYGTPDGVYRLGLQGKINGRNMFTRIIIKKKSMCKNEKLHRARKSKNDEVYTLRCDIVAVMAHHEAELRGKWVYSPFSDYRYSEFCKYFTDNYDKLGLAHYTATCIDNGQGAWRYDYDGKKATVTRLTQGGSFDTPECTAIMLASDVIIDNPPFSRFGDIVKWIQSAPEVKESNHYNTISYGK